MGGILQGEELQQIYGQSQPTMAPPPAATPPIVPQAPIPGGDFSALGSYAQQALNLAGIRPQQPPAAPPQPPMGPQGMPTQFGGPSFDPRALQGLYGGGDTDRGRPNLFSYL